MRYKLIVFDIDGTLIEQVSSWRYIHEKLNLWEHTACRYQERFLAGKISYRKFCELDAAHWRGLPEKKIRDIFKKIPYIKNVSRCLPQLKKMGFKIAAISTGLQYMAARVKGELKFDYCIYNSLISRKGLLTGGVKVRLTHGAKGKVLREVLKRFNVRASEVISIGDSAGDIPLARDSGFSIAFNSSDKTLSKMVDYDCKTKDFKDVFKKIQSILLDNTKVSI